MKNSFTKIAFWLCLLSGISLMYIGINFYVNPVQAELNYGISTSTASDYSFHYIKGIRDFFFGFIIICLLLRKQLNALGWVLLFGTTIPAADLGIVISHPDFSSGHLIAHAIAIVICMACGIYYSRNYTL
ncbi:MULTISPECIES: DUF4267 domain-containing protein [Chryseobacterium]|uniref:Membrane protein YccC n=1 Tax=Chryseobacterium camelliae TaxID=1265445 RepID=A0ABU0TKQ1_9FLAO|nr:MULTISPECIES: DUF4267 domain-containing protein [Chryseobacterium]MDT3408528.1 putative membrane protein YccC [Pseudacidovorax intermedius]MDQ1097617.1 putative membrane protein YccC [Chryseobacterium camelliae]MDQ1101546.1 putative membrane protein YccC [Chryseobacterium sp. SORGH_AS_1048]MDR6084989.1 putative membrane protein YccC [Chryseobacterium sp. SORGH_AS_0909]MDR6129343.1 putative membrane protein YccC [Chryseobacterium sp. SORGH_AS_1175]